MSQEELKIHYRNRSELRKRIAMHGPGAAPLFLHSQLDAVEATILQLERELGLRPLNDLYQRGVQAARDKQWATAIKYLEQVVARDPLYDNAAELLEETRERRLGERIPVLDRPLMKVLRTWVFQVGAIVAVLTLVVAVTWFWPDIRTLLFPPTLTVTPASMNLADARVCFNITSSRGDELTVLTGGTLTLKPGDGILIETRVTVGQLSFPRDLAYQYRAPIGSIPKELVGCRTSYVAPDQPGPDFITVLITDPETGNETMRSINVVVKEESP